MRGAWQAIPAGSRFSWQRPAVLALVSLAVLLASAPRAEAHAAFAKSGPAPGARLETAPGAITLEFTEPLNRPLTKITLVDVRSGRPVKAAIAARTRSVLEIRPRAKLATAAYRVDWHTVSIRDGHPLEGSFGFGVRTAATNAEHSVQLSPFGRGGWLRILARAVFYIALFFFAGGVIVAAVLGRRGDPAAWLAPAGAAAGREVARKAWARTIDAGWAAAAAAAAVAVIEAASASGGLSVAGAREFLLTNLPGLARVGIVLLTAAAAFWATRSPALAAGSILVVFLLIAFSGHANSASPRGLAVISDQAHLVGASAWVGGIAQIALAWLPRLGSTPLKERLAVMRSVLAAFGRVALPAFTLLVAAGLVNAAIQLGSLSALFNSGYGTALLIKVALVGLVALASYWHAVRLRPRLLAANPHPPAPTERRHWRLLGSEPFFAAGALVVAALLVAFPLPPRQLRDGADEATGAAAEACDPCPLPKPTADELGIAAQAGSNIAAVTMRRTRLGLEGTLRILDSDAKPVSEPVKVIGARQATCGPGCWRFEFSGRPSTIAVRTREDKRQYLSRLPALWQGAGNAKGQTLLREAQRTMGHQRALRETERVTSGPGTFALTTYRLQAPNRFKLTTNTGLTSVTVGKRQWSRLGREPWRRARYAGGGPGFKLRSWFKWTAYGRTVRLLGTHRSHGRRIATLALMDEATPAWFYLNVEMATRRVTSARMITSGHYSTQRFYDFNRRQAIKPPMTR